MVREDIAGGLRNAIERGETEEQAKKSFLNANYLEDEIDEALKHLRSQSRETDMPLETPKKKDKKTLKAEKKKLKAEKKKAEKIKEVKDVPKLKCNEIKEVKDIPKPSSQPKKKKIIKYILISIGSLFLIGIILGILLATKVIKL